MYNTFEAKPNCSNDNPIEPEQDAEVKTEKNDRAAILKGTNRNAYEITY